MKQRELSVWIKITAVLGAVCVLFLGGVIAPDIGREFAVSNPDFAHMYAPCLGFIWLTALPVLAVAVCAWLIGGEIGRDNSFCLENAARLRFCCFMAVTDTALYLIGGIVLASLHALHIGIALLILGICAVGVACTVLFASLSHLTARAAAMQSENDLTI